MLSAEQARELVDDAEFLWHQRFELVTGVMTPGPNDVGWLMQRAQAAQDLRGKTALDIGTTNGGAAFELERRGAERVVAVDVCGPDRFGFDVLRDALGSHVEFVQANVYELPQALRGEQFDVVLFWGVLYHLRHPMLALDNLYAVTRWGGEAIVETAVCDHGLPERAGEPLARWYRLDELGADPTNWFSPTSRLLRDWCESSGFETLELHAWPREAPSRAMLRGSPKAELPEYLQISFESPLRAEVRQNGQNAPSGGDPSSAHSG
jgi:tRNA (mo5U34)-methyltransferase